MIRNYIADISTATTGLSVQMQRPGTLVGVSYSSNLQANTGQVEVSRAPSSMIGTAQPDPNSVIARFGLAGTVPVFAQVEQNQRVSTLDRIYLYMTGATNTGVITLSVKE